MKIEAAVRLRATSVPFSKYEPDKEAHAKLPLPKGTWEQVERAYMALNKYEVSIKGDKLAQAVQFYEKLGYKVSQWLAPGESKESWGASVVKMKSPDPRLRLKLWYSQHDKCTYIEFTLVKKP